MIDDYRATTDVFTRMVPYFGIVFLLGALGSFGDRFSGWRQAAVFFAAVALLMAVVALVNRLRGRRPFALPDTIGVIEVGVVLVAAPVLSWLFDGQTSPLQIFIANVVLLAIGYLATSYGLLAMVRWGARQMLREFRGIVTLMARTLPLLLLFATFIFINAEMWQVAHDLPGPLAGVVLGLLLVSASGFLTLRLPTVIRDLEDFASWSEVARIANECDVPLTVNDSSGRAFASPRLRRREVLNIGLLIFIAELVQMLIVASVIGVFYVIFGLLTVRAETLLQWTEIDRRQDINELFSANLFGSEVLMTTELLIVAGAIAAFSALQFATSQLTDEDYRAEFARDVSNELREVLAVRAAYLDATGVSGQVLVSGQAAASRQPT